MLICGSMRRKSRQEAMEKRSLCVALVFLFFSCSKPPTDLLQTARRAIEGAYRMGAGEYAPNRLEEAEGALQRAIYIVQQQRARPFFVRNYGQVWPVLHASFEASSLAKRETMARMDSLRTEAEVEIEGAAAIIPQVLEKMTKVPVNQYNRQRIIYAQIALSEALFALSEEDFLRARAKAQEASVQAMEVQHRVDTILIKYLTPYALAQWKRWVNETIAWSDRHDTYVLIVDKMRRRCDVYFDGKLQASYPVDLGSGPLGHKSIQGDRVTPEGKYRVVAKRDIGHSRYRRSLVLNYPTKEDSIRFWRAKAQGHLPKRAKLGGQIEVHGGGVKGTNWTLGCIALRNEDIDQVFRHVAVGTLVTIVGGYGG